MTNHDLIELLEAHVKVATMATMTDRTFDVKNMGMAHASSEYKKGKYIFVQNFEDLNAAKASGEDQFIRYTFRVVIGRDDDEVHYQIAIWHPSYGNQENAKIIHEYPHGNGDSTFLNLLISAINDTEYTPY